MKETVVFKECASIKLHAELHLPTRQPGETLRPAVVVVHGGGWAKRSGEMSQICKKLNRAGFVAFNITYRLAPEFRHPGQVEDVSSALDWLFSNAERYQIDRQQIAGWGYSAGAHLILMAGLNRPTDTRLAGIVAGGTPADLCRWPHSLLVKSLIGKAYRDAAQEWWDASPVNRVNSSSPPVFLYHGGRDALVEPEQMAVMAAALSKHEVPVETYVSPWLGHISMYLLGVRAQDRAIAFLQRVLARRQLDNTLDSVLPEPSA